MYESLLAVEEYNYLCFRGVDLLIWAYDKCERLWPAEMRSLKCMVGRQFWELLADLQTWEANSNDGLGKKGQWRQLLSETFHKAVLHWMPEQQRFSVRGGQTNSNKIYLKIGNCKTKGQIHNCHIGLLVTRYCENDSFISVQIQCELNQLWHGRSVFSTLLQMLWNSFL